MIDSPNAMLGDPLLEELARTSDARRLEAIADALSDTTDQRAIRPLLWRLGDSIVQDDPDVEDAVCGALNALGVMRSAGSRTFSLRPRDELNDEVVHVLREFAAVLPHRYFVDPSLARP
jgi:hypothetical protein